jgi:hypothetical protein
MIVHKDKLKKEYDNEMDCDENNDSKTNFSDEQVGDFQSNQLAVKETRAVLLLRVAVILALVTCAIAVSISIYKLTRASEHEAFQIQYEGASGKVLKAFEDILQVHAGALASLSVAITTQGENIVQRKVSVLSHKIICCLISHDIRIHYQ